MMRARIVQGLNQEYQEQEIWMIMIQRAKGKRYNRSLLNGMNQPYWTTHKDEAIELCKSLNKRFENEKI